MNTLFFEHLPYIIKFNFINKFSNITSNKLLKVKSKKYKNFVKLIKQYRFIKIVPSKTIKFIKVK